MDESTTPLVGYARVSTTDQNLARQTAALKDVGCIKIFEEQYSGAIKDRPQLNAALRYVRKGDVIVVTELSRLGRSLSHLIEVVTGLEAQGVGFRSLSEHIDTTTSSGRLVFHMMGALAEFERQLIRERTLAGLEQAKLRGVTLGRKKVMTQDRLALAKRMLDEGESVRTIADVIGVGRSTLYRHLESA
jgi:DNA invertase Pin-like site-specific DNA recombinase